MKLKIREISIFALIAALMFATKKLMELLPNIHLLGVFIIATTVVYRAKALYPLYTYVLLDGIFLGFSIWWMPYLYIWTILWAVTMLLPKQMPKKIAPFVYMTVCGLHGLLFGILYAPAQAFFFGLNFEGTLAWILKGFPFDLVHGVSNLAAGTLILPLITLLRKAETYTG